MMTAKVTTTMSLLSILYSVISTTPSFVYKKITP